MVVCTTIPLEETLGMQGRVVSCRLNPYFLRKKLIYPNGQVTNFDYHGEPDDFRLKEIKNLEAGIAPEPFSVFEYTYSPMGMIETWTQQIGTENPNIWAFGYDRAYQLRDAVHRDSENDVIESFSYGYDRVGNRTHERHAAGTLGDSPGRGALHNENNQLTSYSDAGAVRFAGEIDQGGIVWVDGQQAEMDVDDSGAQPVQTFEVWISLEPGIQQILIDAVNESGKASQETYELTVADQGRVDFTYDAVGNMISRSDGVDTTEYRWDGENRLVEIVYPDTSRTEFEYDGFGRRMRIHEKNSGGALPVRIVVHFVKMVFCGVNRFLLKRKNISAEPVYLSDWFAEALRDGIYTNDKKTLYL